MKNSHKILFNAFLLSGLALMPAVAFEKADQDLGSSQIQATNNINSTPVVQQISLEQPTTITKAPDQNVNKKAKVKKTASQGAKKGFSSFLSQIKNKEEKDHKNKQRTFGTEKIPLQNPSFFFDMGGFFGPWGPFNSSGVMAILYAKDSQGRLHLTYPDYDGSYHLFLDTQTKYSFNIAILSAYNNQSLKDYATIMNFWRYICLPYFGDPSIFHDWAHPGNRQDSFMASQFMFKEMPFPQPIDYDSGGNSGGHLAYPNMALYDPVDDGRIGEKFESLLNKVAVNQPKYNITPNISPCHKFLNFELKNTNAIGRKEIKFNPTYIPYNNLNTSSFYNDNIFSDDSYEFTLDIEDPSIKTFINTAAIESDSGGPYYPTDLTSIYSQQFYVHLRAQPRDIVLTQSTTNFDNLMLIDPLHPDPTNYETGNSLTRNGFAQFTVPNDAEHIIWTIEGEPTTYVPSLPKTIGTQQNPNPKVIGNTATHYADLTLSQFTNVTTPSTGMLSLHAKQADCQGNVYRYGTTLAPLYFFSYEAQEG